MVTGQRLMARTSLSPKPKWMRWRTYNRYVERLDRYEAILDEGVEKLIAKLLPSNFFADQ